jgi:hypothetical protein
MFSLGDPGASPLEAAAPQPAAPTNGGPDVAPQPQPPGHQQPPGNALAPVEIVHPDQYAPQPAPSPPETGATPRQPKPNMVEDLASKTGKAVTDTGKAVGGAVKKSWDCVASLFGNC